jgi:hypothetical protein
LILLGNFYADVMTGRDDRLELADAGRLARKLLARTVRMARTEDQALRRVLLEHLGDGAAHQPTVAASYPVYEQVNVQVGVDAWLAADPARTHELIGITGVSYLQHLDATISDIMRAARRSGPRCRAGPTARPTRASATASTWSAMATTGW